MQPLNLVQDKLLTLATSITRNVQALSISHVTMPRIYRWKDGCFFVCLVMAERALNEETYHHYKYLVSNYVKDHPVWKETPPILTVQFRPSLHFTITILPQNPHVWKDLVLVLWKTFRTQTPCCFNLQEKHTQIPNHSFPVIFITKTMFNPILWTFLGFKPTFVTHFIMPFQIITCQPIIFSQTQL